MVYSQSWNLNIVKPLRSTVTPLRSTVTPLRKGEFPPKAQ
jgi:hypothetical protein